MEPGNLNSTEYFHNCLTNVVKVTYNIIKIGYLI